MTDLQLSTHQFTIPRNSASISSGSQENSQDHSQTQKNPNLRNNITLSIMFCNSFWYLEGILFMGYRLLLYPVKFKRTRLHRKKNIIYVLNYKQFMLSNQHFNFIWQLMYPPLRTIQFLQFLLFIQVIFFYFIC